METLSAPGVPSRILAYLAAFLTVSLGATAQSFQLAPQLVPQGAPFNASYTESLDFADVDLDGDWDAIFADGGDFGNDQNRLWINMGGAQGGTLGVFQDRTSTQLPSLIDDSRDVDFIDIDDDGDADVFTSNTSQIVNQTCRWWINMGGIQGGTAGFFTDQTSTRYRNIGVNNASSSSSVASSLTLAAGGFIDWSGDSSFADLDGDGFRDLFQSTYGALSGGNVPARIFLNDGSGVFEEFNPSGFQLSGTEISNGMPALWAQGTQQDQTTNTVGQRADIATLAMSLEFGDLDGDYDIDILHGNRTTTPRIFRNLDVEQGGQLAFRDITAVALPSNWVMGSGKYEQELGDLDNDGDLDIYGMNWIDDFCDAIFTNQGTGQFTYSDVGDSCQRESQANFLDYDNDGDIDVFLTRLSYSERVQRNAGAAGGYAFAPGTVLLPASSSHSWGADLCDVDGDGDSDALVANDLNQPNELLINAGGVADSFAPRIPHLVQAADRAAGAAATIVRAQVYDNAASYQTGENPTSIEYAVNGGAFSSLPMRWAGGQIFRAEIPGQLVGTITYRVVSRDEQGNTGSSATLAYQATPCDSGAFTYCTAKLNSCGTLPAISFQGAPSASAASGFVLESSGARAGKQGLLLYGTNGPAALPFQGGTLCLAGPGIRRGPLVTAIGGSAGPVCDAVFRMDMNAFASGQAGGNPSASLHTIGQHIQVQWWGRDSVAIGTLLSDAIEYAVCP
ncbi:MAG TPA: VCBS repeat-containing protein [Planctomycetota bacterium]|nr:VCBS repeat-containing protein [Planctomycetota bacterium]